MSIMYVQQSFSKHGAPFYIDLPQQICLNPEYSQLRGGQLDGMTCDRFLKQHSVGLVKNDTSPLDKSFHYGGNEETIMLSTLKKEASNCAISHILERLNTLNMTQLIPFFADLPIDPYLEGNYRFRRLSHFRISDHRVMQLPHMAMFQSKTHNPLLGNVVREYAELDPELIKCPDFQALILEFFEFCRRCSTSTEVGVHQIRITADQGVGNPAPEGIHRDGVDIIGIVCVNRDGVAGGETHLYESKNRSPVFTKVLNPGELLVVNDQQLFHFTTPIQSRSPGAGVRDVFVLTCPGLPASSR